MKNVANEICQTCPLKERARETADASIVVVAGLLIKQSLHDGFKTTMEEWETIQIDKQQAMLNAYSSLAKIENNHKIILKDLRLRRRIVDSRKQEALEWINDTDKRLGDQHKRATKINSIAKEFLRRADDCQPHLTIVDRILGEYNGGCPLQNTKEAKALSKLKI